MEVTKTLPPAAQFILTRRVPCAALAIAMFTSMLWLPALFQAVLPLAIIASFAGMALHLMTPGLFALILFGGGFTYAVQTAAIAALGITLLGGMELMGGLLFGLMYAMLPIVVAGSLQRPGGIGRSGRHLAIGMFLAVITPLLILASSQDMDMHAFAAEKLQPFFNQLSASIPAGESEQLAQMESVWEATVWTLPGFMAFGLWMMWWLSTVFARHVAISYGFYQGDRTEMLHTRFGKEVGIALLIAVAAANIFSGSPQYVAISASILLAGIVAIQGISVAHLWLQMRGQQLALFAMYILLFVWPMAVFPCIALGLLDLWFDYRRKMFPAYGGK